MNVLITEIRQPLMVRRKVSFGEAVYAGGVSVEGITAKLVTAPVAAPSVEEVHVVFKKGEIPVVIDPDASIREYLQPDVVVDGRMLKQFLNDEYSTEFTQTPPFIVGLGPGYIAGDNCHAAVETKRGHFLGRVVWHGPTEADTGIPDRVGSYERERVLRAPTEGEMITLAEIGDRLIAGQPVAEIAGQRVVAPFPGVLRGILHPGLRVWSGLKIGDVDPRGDPRFCYLVSDKSLAIAGGCLEAILTHFQLLEVGRTK